MAIIGGIPHFQTYPNIFSICVHGCCHGFNSFLFVYQRVTISGIRLPRSFFENMVSPDIMWLIIWYHHKKGQSYIQKTMENHHAINGDSSTISTRPFSYGTRVRMSTKMIESRDWIPTSKRAGFRDCVSTS